METIKRTFRNFSQSRFMRSVFVQVLSIVLIVSIAIVAVVFFSFASEMNRNIISDRQKQLAIIEDTISMRMDEISSIAYNVSRDPVFHMEPIADARYSGYEMSNTLSKYLIGNDFIEHLVFYRLAEPNKIYSSGGELTFHDFWSVYLNFDDYTEAEYLKLITSTTGTAIIPMSEGRKSCFAYICALPLFSTNPRAFIVVFVPRSELEPLLRSQLTGLNGEVAIFDADDNEIYRVSTLDMPIPMEQYVNDEHSSEEYISVGNAKFVLQKDVSQVNGWTYVSVLRLGDIISGLANRQLVFIVLLLGIMFIAIFAMVVGINRKYKPISNLANEVSDKPHGKQRSMIDESTLLSNRIATLKEDSEQKQMFENAYYEADAASKAKSAFLSNMSHDIRTPMNAVIGMTALASKHAEEPEYVRDCLGKVQIASRYLLDIMNDVLDMSRIESGRFALSEAIINLPELINELVAILEQSVEAKEQRLTVNVDIADKWVITDGVRLTQVFVNILSNAVKFTPNGGVIGMEARQAAVSEAGYGDYVFTFTDTGIGMSEEFVNRVFDTFTRSKEADASRIEGTGLGMAIAKNLVNMLGGDITCESEQGRGTTFTVNLRMRLAPAPEETGGAAEGTVSLEGINVLVAEDNAINRELARKVLSDANANAEIVSNGQEALETFIERPQGYFNVILMDVHMPVMDGFEAAEAIRSLDRADAHSVPIYAMTASAYDEDADNIARAGMNGHIGKPYTPQELYDIIRNA